MNTPFKCAVLYNLFEDEKLLHETVKELNTLKLNKKNNDMYKVGVFNHITHDHYCVLLSFFNENFIYIYVFFSFSSSVRVMI